MANERFPLLQLLRQNALSRLQASSRIPGITIEEVPDGTQLLGHHMSLILLVGQALKITFKTHFRSRDAQAFAARAYDKAPESISPSQASDFVAEYCNLTAGLTKTPLEEQGLSTGISLPLSTRSFDELFFPSGIPSQSHEDRWRLTCPQGYFTCSSAIEIFDPKAVAKYQYAAPAVEDGSVDFL